MTARPLTHGLPVTPDTAAIGVWYLTVDVLALPRFEILPGASDVFGVWTSRDPAYAEHRDRARRRHAEEDLPFVEVYVDTPLEVCEARDPKGLYRRARAGKRGLTGVDDPYQPPPEPDLGLEGTRPIEDGVAALESLLRERDLL